LTHTNFREGTLETYKRDYVVLVMPAKGFNNREDIGDKLRDIWRIMYSYKPINGGGVSTGMLLTTPAETIIEKIENKTPMLLGVYSDKDTVNRVIRDIKAADRGISVVVSGLIEDTAEIAKANGLNLHSIEYVLGIHGRRDLLPPEHIREVTTMCGHGLISSHLVAHLLEQVKGKKMGVDDAVTEIGRQCICGIFNTEKARFLFERALKAEMK